MTWTRHYGEPWYRVESMPDHDRCDLPLCPQCDPPQRSSPATPGSWQGVRRAGPAAERLVAAALEAQNGTHYIERDLYADLADRSKDARAAYAAHRDRVAAFYAVQPQTPAAGDSGSTAVLERDRGNPNRWPMPDRYRLQSPDGSISAQPYSRLSDAIEAIIDRPGRFAIYRETAEGDLKLCARVSGRGAVKCITCGICDVRQEQSSASAEYVYWECVGCDRDQECCICPPGPGEPAPTVEP